MALLRRMDKQRAFAHLPESEIKQGWELKGESLSLEPSTRISQGFNLLNYVTSLWVTYYFLFLLIHRSNKYSKLTDYK